MLDHDMIAADVVYVLENARHRVSATSLGRSSREDRAHTQNLEVVRESCSASL